MADKVINTKVRQRYDTEANWKSKDPVLLSGEMAISSDKNGMYKIGNGTAKWSALSYSKAMLDKNDVIAALGYTPPTSNTWRGIQDNLTSTSTSDSLSANQGRVLKGLIEANNSTFTSVLSGKANVGHTHSTATTNASGFMSSTDKIKLDTLASEMDAYFTQEEINIIFA